MTATQAQAPAWDHAPVELPQPVRMRILFAVMVGIFLAALDQTVVGTALPRIVTDLRGNDVYTWAFTAYLLTATISGPIYGKLSDLYGRRPIFLLGIGIFLFGSVLAGLSPSIEWFIVARGIQGLGAGALFPIALAIIGDIFAPSERGKYQGLFGAVFGLSILIGPAVGGLLTDTLGWPWVFFVNLPVGAVVVYLVWRYLPSYHLAGDRPKIDFVGAALFTAALVPILVGLTNKQSADWADPTVGGLLLLGAVFLVAFLFVESRVAEPIVPLSLFRIRSFSVSVSATFLAAFGFFAAVVFLPRWFQVVNGSSATESGYQILPLLGGLIISAVASGQIVSRTGRYRWLIFAALVISAVGLYLLSTMHANTPIPQLWLVHVHHRHRRRPDVRGVHPRRPEQRPHRPARHGHQQPDLLPAGRRHRRPGHHRHHLRLGHGRTGAAAGRRRAGAAGAGRDDGVRRVGRQPAHGRRGPRRGHLGWRPGGRQGPGRALHPGARERHLRGLLAGNREHVDGRHRDLAHRRRACAPAPRGPGRRSGSGAGGGRRGYPRARPGHRAPRYRFWWRLRKAWS